jgi:hypothetical protein
MRVWLILISIFTLTVTPAFAATQTDLVLAAGLEAFEVNGISAGVRIWYTDNPRLAADLQAKLQTATKDLGGIVGTEVLASRALSRRVQRYHLVIYFRERPLWVQIDRYTVGPKIFFLPLTFSTVPEEILPEEITGR